MANKAISELPQALNVNNQDLFVLEQSGIAKKLPAETFITEQGIIDALAEALDGHGGISSVTLASVSGRIRTYRITFTDQSATTFQVYDGTSIDRISRTSSSGLDDVYTIFLSDGTTTFFTVHNGADGTVSEAMLNDALRDKAPAITETTESSVIANFTDGADDMPLHNILAEINPVQDLNGYDNPWPAGGGKNKLPMLTAPQTISGVTATPNADGSITLTGASNNAIVYFDLDTAFDSTTYAGYVITGLPISGSWDSSNVMFRICSANDRSGLQNVTTADGRYLNNVVVDNGQNLRFSIRVINNYTVPSGGLTLKPMLREASESDTFAPYANICPITGHTEVNVTRTGVNIWDEEWENGYIDASGALIAYASAIRSKNYCVCKPNTTYYLKRPAGMTGHGVAWYTADKQFINRITNTTIVTAPNDAYFFKVSLYNYKSDGKTEYLHDVSLNYPSTDTVYHEGHIQSIPINWSTEAGTVYGGTIDVATGLLTVDRAIVTIDGTGIAKESSTWSTWEYVYYKAVTPTGRFINASAPNIISNQTYAVSYSGLKNANKAGVISFTGNGGYLEWTSSAETLAEEQARLSSLPMQVVYELATPQTYQLTPQEVKTLLGTNNVWTDIGNVSVTYAADTKMFIEKLTMPTEDDLVANQAITSGKYFMIGNSLYLALANIASGAQITIGTNAQRVSLADALNTINS